MHNGSNEWVTSESEAVKHPLEHTWSFWLNTNESKNWLENLKELTDFNTVEDYWSIYHHTKLPSEIKSGQDYAVFKKGITPTWEDKTNRPGGLWYIILDKRPNEIDNYWLDVVLLMIGENFGEANDMVCGAIVNVRNERAKRDAKTKRCIHKISIWTNTQGPANLLIGKKIKQELKINFKLLFYTHTNKTPMYSC